MSRLANPWDNAKCESFMKTLKREEIHANEYRGLDDLRKNVATFVDVYYNTQRLHSALGYNTPEHFEATLSCAIACENREVSFCRHREIFRSDGSSEMKPPEGGPPNHRLDESPTGYSSPGWSPPVGCQTFSLVKEVRKDRGLNGAFKSPTTSVGPGPVLNAVMTDSFELRRG
jgi:hypothetical protein